MCRTPFWYRNLLTLLFLFLLPKGIIFASLYNDPAIGATVFNVSRKLPPPPFGKTFCFRVSTIFIIFLKTYFITVGQKSCYTSFADDYPFHF